MEPNEMNYTSDDERMFDMARDAEIERMEEIIRKGDIRTGLSHLKRQYRMVADALYAQDADPSDTDGFLNWLEIIMIHLEGAGRATLTAKE